MKLYVPRKLVAPTDTGDAYPMDLNDWSILAEVMDQFESFDQLKKCVGRRMRDEQQQLAYDWARKFMTVPCSGSNHDTFVALVNVFGQFAEEHDLDTVPTKLPQEMVIALLCSELDLTETTAKKRLLTLINGRWVERRAGYILFPIKYFRKEAME